MIIDEYGREIRSLPEQVSKNQSDIATLDSDLVALAALVQNALAGVLHYKGSVATYGDLPTSGQEVGDVYNVIDTGANYAWDGSAWDELGSIIDTSLFAEKAGNNTFTGSNEFDGNVDFYGSIQTVLFGDQTTVLSNSGYGFAEQDSQTAYIAHNAAYEEFNFYDVNSGHSIMFDFANEKIYSTASAMDLGDSTHKYKDLYLSGTAHFDNFYITENSGMLTLYDSSNSACLRADYQMLRTHVIRAFSDNAYDIGTSAIRYKDLYLGGNIYLPTNGAIYSNSNLCIRFSPYTFETYTFRPIADNSYDIGSSSKAYKHLFIKGNLSNGTDTATVTDIAALIAYAKAQGWIS